LDANKYAITLEAWINYAGYNPSNYMGIMAHDGWDEGYRLVIRDNGDPLYFHLPEDASWLGASQDTPTDEWVHVVGVYDGSNMMIYINGAKDSNTQSKTSAIEATLKDFWIGHGDNEVGQSYSYPWTGYIDEVRVSTYARSLDWIATQFNNQNDTASFLYAGVGGALQSYKQCHQLKRSLYFRLRWESIRLVGWRNPCFRFLFGVSLR
jgi:hypothetical protein